MFKNQTVQRNYAEEATIPLKPFKTHLIDAAKLPKTAKLTKKAALWIWENMNLIRRSETEAANLYKDKKIIGFCHLYPGMEAVAAGIKQAMAPQDDLITSYRCHAWALLFLKEKPVEQVLSELMGRMSGCQNGKGGSMHMYVPPQMMGGQAIVGAQVPLGAGLALAHQYKGDKGVTFTLYGDGAANQGQVYEAFNIAHLKKLPAVFVCENNKYGMGTSDKRSSSSTEYYKNGNYIPGIWADGMDVLSVREITKVACEHCRSGKGPIILELSTYRYYGHSMSDPGTSYRKREEVQEVRQTRDPINVFKKLVEDAKLCTEAELKGIVDKVKQMCTEAKAVSLKGPIPDQRELTTHVYAQPLEAPRLNVVGKEL